MNNSKRRRASGTPNLFYITHRDNLPSIFQHGVLSHALSQELSPTTVYNEDIVTRRGERKTPDGRSLWQFANFYFQPRNPMLYRVYCCEKQNVVILRLQKRLISIARYVSIGNAANSLSRFEEVERGIAEINSSKMQTITISVNTVGVMGAGLASRAKENFPHIYVAYQELCRNRKLTTRSPYLYKEKFSYDSHMADEPNTLTQKPNDERCFLLFATKEDWRNPSTMEYLEGGLHWLLENAAKEGIQSLAMPALGCGLGGLPWYKVGPLMCQYLHKLDIDCEIYLPREDRIPEAQLSETFLLADRTVNSQNSASA